MSSGRGKRAVFAGTLLLLSLLVSFLLAEGLLRLAGYRGEPVAKISQTYAVDDPILDWRYLPNTEYRAGRVVYDFNSAGFRDVDHAIERPEGVVRVAVVGDSVSEGYGVEWESVFTPTLQRGLGEGFEVITFAQGGLNTPQQVHLLEQVGLDYEPSVVIVNLVLNDCDFPTRRAAAQSFREEKDSRIGLLFDMPVPPELKRMLKSSAVLYLLKERANELRTRLGEDGEQDDYYVRLWKSDKCRARIEAGFADLARIRDAHDLDVLVVVWPLIVDYRNYPLGFAHAWLGEQAGVRGLEVIDLLQDFEEHPFRSLQVSAEDNVHPNAVGHAVGVERAAGWLRQRGWVPEPRRG